MITSEYFEFIKLKGRPLSEINQGSDEIALSIDVIFDSIELLKRKQLPVRLHF